VDLPPSGKERALTASRDKTAQLYKIPEATRLVFRGFAHVGSLEVVRAVSDSYFLTGSQDGALSLWHVTRKKPVATALLAHGTGIHVPMAYPHAPADVMQAALANKGDATPYLPAGALARSEDGPHPDENTIAAIQETTGADPAQGLGAGYCNWINAIAVCPNGDIVATGSGDGFVRFWRLVQRGFQGPPPPGTVLPTGKAAKAASKEAATGMPKPTSVGNAHFVGLQHVAAVPVKGIVNGLSFAGDGSYLACAVGAEQRLGRWWRYKGAGVRNGIVIIPLPTMAA
jgi:ribosomal RNA-processing protein 9